jgi:hypothetical protein
MFDLYARLESITIVLFADFLYNMIELLELGFRLLSPFHDKGFESELFLLLSRVFTKVNLQFGDEICVFDVLVYCEL